jgi:hypothetical protein
MSKIDLYSSDEKKFTLITIIIMYRHEKEKAQPSISTANPITLAPKVLKKTTMKDGSLQKAPFCGTNH